MKISKADVENVAKLARLEVTETEKDAFTQQLSGILTYVEKLNRLKTEGVEPTATVLGQTNVFREDKARPSLPVGKATANAPESADGFFVVPKIIEDR
jgi:aspartyl-tRNA(Asn)/glutamyl-tRNA(Gln) amidotransferase subunit C